MIKEIKLPEVSDNVETGDVVKILVKVGDKISADQPIIELETDKALFEVPSTEEGIVTEISVKEGEVIHIGDIILKIEANGSASVKENTVQEKQVIPEEKNVSENVKNSSTENIDRKIPEHSESEMPVSYNSLRESAPASPSIRRLARELGVDINNVSGSGTNGRITEEDLKEFVKSKMKSGGATSPGITRKPLPDFKKWGEVEIHPMTKVRSITAESMSDAWTSIPMVTQFDKADITVIEQIRKKYSKKFEEKTTHLTITSILVKICSVALKKFPQFNSSIDLNKREIIFKKFFNIGIAVDSDRGLLVPVIKDAGNKDITEISIELNELAKKVRDKKINPEDMEGGNFTISNLGGIGGTGFTPIVYPPQVSILGVSRASIEPVFIDEKFEPRLMLPMALTYDHRIIDGADAARFLRWVCEALENPLLISM